MSTAEKQRYSEILDAALALDEAERTRFLARYAESEVPAIRDAILGILASDTPSDGQERGLGMAFHLYGESNLPDVGSLVPPPHFVDSFFPGSPDGTVLSELLAQRHDHLDNPFAGTDRFEVIRLLGKGGFGEVYEVWDRSHRSQLALKVLRNLHPAALESFKRESRLPERIVHPNLCQTWELIFDAPSRLWLLTMELVRGRHLSAFLRDHRHRLRDVFFQVSDGLNALHAAGVLHCDIKPSNVLVTGDGHVKMLDFGLVRLHNSALIGTPVGATPEYAAPELRAGNPNSISSDWYAFGVMLYRALTNESPFPFRNRTNSFVLEPAVEPELADLARLAVQLLQSDPASRLLEPDFSGILATSRSPSGFASLFLAGRDHEICTLRNAFAECLEQNRCVVVEVIGDAGIGKTALIQTFLSQVSTTSPDVVILTGKCYEGESVPYKALDELIDALAARLLARSLREARRILPADFPLLARLFPILETVLPPAPASGAPPAAQHDPPDPLPLRRRAFSAFRQLIQNMRAVAPLILFIDDLQWGDSDSALLLRELTHSEAPAVLLLLARRGLAAKTEEANHLRSTCTIDLRPLQPTQSMSLVRDLLGPCDPSVALDETAAQIAAESGGSPFLIRQLVEHYRRGGVSGGNRLQHIINVRAAALGEPERRLLEVLSVARAPLSRDVLRQAAELGEQAFAARISLVRQSLACDSDSTRNTCSAFHDRIAEAVVEALPNARRLDIHLRLATSLETAPDPEAETIARHYHAAERPLDACRLGRLAAERASTAFAFDRAARLYSEVLEWAAQARLWNEAERSPVCCELGNALVNAGRGIDGARAYADAIEGAPSASRIHLRIRFAEELLRSGEVDEGLSALRRILREHHLPVPVAPRAAMAG